MSNRTFGVITSYEADAGFGTWDRYVDFTADLDTGETLSGTPEVDTSDTGFTISDIAVNTAEINDGTTSIAVGKAVQFRITTTTEQTLRATLKVSCATTDSNRKTVTVYQPIKPTDAGS